jgi:hypothetical protein
MNRLPVFVVLSLLAPGAAALAQPVPGNAPPHMTTQGAEYCAHLNGEVAQAQHDRVQAPGEALLLADEGARMCDRGHYRAGVARLRRALSIMRGGN